MKRLTDSAMDRKWETHEAVISQCREQGLQQSAYFFERDLSFRCGINLLTNREGSCTWLHSIADKSWSPSWPKN